MGLNPLLALRLQHLFNPQNMGNYDDSGSSVAPSFEPNASYDNIPDLAPQVNPSIASQWQPSNTASDALTGAVNQMPKRSDFAPSFMRKLGASFAGMASKTPFETASKISNQPFQDALGDWSNKVKPLEYSANLEQARNKEGNANIDRDTKEAALEKDKAQQRSIADQREQTRIKQQAAQEEMWKAREKVATDRAATYKFKSTHPNWIHVQDKEGNLVFVNPQDPTETQVTDIQLTTPQEKNEWKVAGDLKEIQARIAGQLQVEGVKGNNASNLEGQKQEGRTNLEDTKQTNRTVIEGQKQTGKKELKQIPVAPKTTTKETVIPGSPGFFGIGGRDEQKKVETTTTTTGQQAIKLKDKTGKEWMVKPENVEAFKKANGIQ